MNQNNSASDTPSADPIFEEEPLVIPMDRTAWFTPLGLLGALVMIGYAVYFLGC